MPLRFERIASLVLLSAFNSTMVLAQVSDVTTAEHVTREFEGERPEPPKSADLEATVGGIIERSNAFREREGREPLDVDQTLQKTAQDFADYMAETDRYGHQADGRTPSQRAKAHGYDYAIVLENIAFTYDSRGYEAPALAEKFVQGWIESPPHRENLLDPDVTEIGAGVAVSESTQHYYAVQMFGRPGSLSIEFSIFNVSQTAIPYEVRGRTYVIEPRYTRTHTFGRPPEVTFKWPEDSEKQPTVVKPENGTRYRIETAVEGGFQLETTKETPEEETPQADASRSAAERPVPASQAPETTPNPRVPAPRN
ncbi:MAG TPA: CAP domain-containing protein [Pirellulaceae bacterium]|jgi:uncharacterized protein YkwD|nr:CAP domain-containing protein [Pirellulaceae bacterium]